MLYLQLGEDQIPAIALGTSGWGRPDEEQAEKEALFRQGIADGYTLWDTAAIYGNGTAEAVLGQMVDRYRPDCLISTKYTPSGFERKKRLYHVFEKSMERLHKETIDFYWIHNASNVRKWTKTVVPLVKEGKIRHIGVANHELREIQQASHILRQEGLKLSAVQDHFSLLFQRVRREGIFSWCEAQEIPFFGYFVLEQGVFQGDEASIKAFVKLMKLYGGKPKRIFAGLKELHGAMDVLAEKYQVKKEAIAVAYALFCGVLPMVEMEHAAQLEITEQAMALQIDGKEFQALELIAEKIEGSWMR